MSRTRTALVAFAVAASQPLVAAQAGEIIGEPPFSFPLGGCGEIVYDEVCQTLLRLDDGTHYSFAGIDQYAIGDRLFVAGDVCLICLLTACGSPYAALMNVVTLECEASGKGGSIPFDGCVEVVVDDECGPLLQTEDGLVFYGEPFVSSEQEGLRFHAVGELSGQFTVLCPGNPVPDMLPFFVDLTLAGCSGDLNADGKVDGADLAGLLASWGADCAAAGTCFADIDGDGAVDGADLAMLLAAWG